MLGHRQAFFAPAAAIITLGISASQRRRRALEVALGVALGILVADIIVLWIGSGAWQLAVVVFLSLSVARLLGSGPTILNQAAISAVLVTTVQPPVPGGGIVLDRFYDALVGGGVALLIGAVVLSGDPVAAVRRAAGPVLSELASVLDELCRVVRSRNPEEADDALDRARRLDELSSGFHQAVDTGRESTWLAPGGRRRREHLDHLGLAAGQVDLAVRNVRVLARGITRGIRLGDSMPPDTALALADLAQAVRALEHALQQPARAEDVRAPALRAAGRATLLLERTGNLSISVVVGQVRSTAVDLLRGSGLDADEAYRLLSLAAADVEARELAEPR